MKYLTIIVFLFIGISNLHAQSGKVQCTGNTQKGFQCKRMVTSPETRCFDHGGKLKEIVAQGESRQCICIANSTGLQCQKKTRNLNGKCSSHQSSNNIASR